MTYTPLIIHLCIYGHTMRITYVCACSQRDCSYLRDGQVRKKRLVSRRAVTASSLSFETSVQRLVGGQPGRPSWRRGHHGDTSHVIVGVARGVTVSLSVAVTPSSATRSGLRSSVQLIKYNMVTVIWCYIALCTMYIGPSVRSERFTSGYIIQVLHDG